MLFIETKVFSKQIDKLLNNSDYMDFQNYLAENYESGVVIKGSGGLRKIRWKKDGSGKSGGIRIIYYTISHEGTILLLLAYSKSDSEDMTPEQLKILKKIVSEELSNE